MFLFEPLGMNTALIETDSEGIFIASSFSWMTARDWARIGMLFGNDGIWENKRILPIGQAKINKDTTPDTREFRKVFESFCLLRYYLEQTTT